MTTLLRRAGVFVLSLVASATLAADIPQVAPAPRAVPVVVPVSDVVRETWKLDPFYQKHIDLDGLPILSSAKVSDAGVLEAARLIRHMLAHRPDILPAMVKNKCRFVVMAPTEMTTDVPEQRHLKNDPKTDWDKRARGLGGKITSCGEENLLNLKGDRYRNENILIHEFSHAIHRFGIGSLDPKFDGKLKAVYARAMEMGLWKDTYAASNHSEYWAEGVQSYYDCNNPPNKGVHNDINTREKLQKYDPALYELIDETFGQNPWRYVRYDKRNPQAKELPAIVYSVKFPAPDKRIAEVEATFPTGGQAAIDLMMPIWSPGFYRVENYAGKVQTLTARSPDGTAMKVEQPKKNRWQITTGGAAAVVVSYKLLCDGRSITTNWVGDDMLVLNGGAAFPTLVEQAKRPHEVKLELPAKWKRSMTGLDAVAGVADHYRAADYDTLVDSPIVAGNLEVHEFTVADSKHFVVAVGDLSQWDGKRAAADLEKIVREHHRMWGFLPFKKYAFLLVFRQGGGGLEHLNSTLATTSPTSQRTPGGYLSWLMFISHEYFHAFNVKRLRPVELGPFDYEKEPRTTGLWVAEGLTSYYGEMIVARCGLGTPADWLARLSGHIDQLQKSPGRLLQTLEQSSSEVWTNSFSGVKADGKTVSYYVKGPVVGFLLDARIRKATDGKKSLDDLMKLAYERYSGERGFTADEFRKTAEDVAGVDLKEWFRKALASTEELDYTEALDWFGLRFAPTDDKQAEKRWRLEVREDATDDQKRRFRAWMNPAGK